MTRIQQIATRPSSAGNHSNTVRPDKRIHAITDKPSAGQAPPAVPSLVIYHSSNLRSIALLVRQDMNWGCTDSTWVQAPAFEVAHLATELANATTPKAFHNKAQRRAAHAGSTKNASGKPQRGITSFVVKPRWVSFYGRFAFQGALRDPGLSCATASRYGKCATSKAPDS